MSNDLIWQQNSSNLKNKASLDAIASWWSELEGKEVAWQQRLLPDSGDVSNLDWQAQKFDEKLILATPEMRGITLYWHINQGQDERNITPSKLNLNPTQQRLYIFPQSQSQVVISVSLPQAVYEKINLQNPQLAATVKNNQGIILLRDKTTKKEVKVTLSPEQISQLFEQLKTINNQ
ncbi:MAG: hypothetical protein AAF652_21200 [Cyanobacteria bacterium P01_C01_bin.72]